MKEDDEDEDERERELRFQLLGSGGGVVDFEREGIIKGINEELCN